MAEYNDLNIAGKFLSIPKSIGKEVYHTSVLGTVLKWIPRVLFLASAPVILFAMGKSFRSIDHAVRTFPKEGGVLKVFATYDATTSTNVIVVIHKRLLPKPKGLLEEWEGYRVWHLSSTPSLEAKVIVSRISTKGTNTRGDYEGKAVIKRNRHTEENMKNIINQNCDELFKKYSTLTVIKPDWVKSRDYTSDNPTDVNLQQTPCIVFYVLKKGLIPLGEDLLPSSLGGFVTDVREGMFYHLADNPPGTLAATGHRNAITLHPGCGVSSQTDKRGSLGGFARCLSSNTTGFLTSYHLFFNFRNENPHPSGGESVYYVDDRRQFRSSGVSCGSISPLANQRVFGNVQYNNETYGVDALFVPIEHAGFDRTFASQDHDERTFIQNRFPELPENLQFDMRPISVEDLEGDSLVYKYGHYTHLSEGEFDTSGIAVRSVSSRLVPSGMEGTEHDCAYKARNLLSVKDIQGARGHSNAFAERGDSGAFAFVLKDNKLRVVGMVEGELTEGLHMVIPIQPVLEYMQLELI